MAADMKAVKLRMKSIESTRQITRAMDLVAASKLRRFKERAEAIRPYFHILREALEDIAGENTDFSSCYTRKNAPERWLYVVMAGDRGLAGGYNANLFREFARQTRGKPLSALPIGKKATEYCRRAGIPLVTEAFSTAESLAAPDCARIAQLLCAAYRAGEYGHMALCYTAFRSVMTQVPEEMALLPLEDFGTNPSGQAKTQPGTATQPGMFEESSAVTNVSRPARPLILYEPDSESVFDAIVPEYLSGLLYGALCQSTASELAARRTAMDAATRNAGEMLEHLTLYYNRARQAGITQEITEIVAGAEHT